MQKLSPYDPEDQEISGHAPYGLMKDLHVDSPNSELFVAFHVSQVCLFFCFLVSLQLPLGPAGPSSLFHEGPSSHRQRASHVLKRGACKGPSRAPGRAPQKQLKGKLLITICPAKRFFETGLFGVGPPIQSGVDWVPEIAPATDPNPKISAMVCFTCI